MNDTAELDTLRRTFTKGPLLDAAFAEAGRDHFDDESFMPGLEMVLGIPERTNISATGLAIMQANSLRWLVTRLRYEADVEKHPEILDEHVDDPIVVLGLPRSGTTKLQRFLSADPNLQATPAWMMFNPAPFPGEQPGNPQPRIDWANAMMKAVTNTGESYQVMHEFAGEEPDESSFMPLAQFDYPMQAITAPDATFLAWARARSRVPALTWSKKMLQYLQWQQGGRKGPWLLKNPGNTGEVAEMFEVFPKATFVISQRDLTKTMGSSMRMMTEILVNSFDDVDMNWVGDQTVEYWAYELNRYQRQREELGSRLPIVETPYNRCVSDALSVAREVYELAGLPLTPEGEAAMRQWDNDNPRHKLGSYGYSLEDYGWNEKRIEDAFGPIARKWHGM